MESLRGVTAGQLLHQVMDSFQSPEERGFQLLDHAYKHLTPLPPLPKGKICALPGCRRKVGLPPWTIMGKPEEYCSRACTDLVFQAGKKARQGVQAPAQDFGGLLTRMKCDVCGGSVLINWKSRDGKDCCSRECQKKAEEDSMTDTETNDTPTTDPKPITAGAAAPAKKSSKKAAAKAAPAKAKKLAKKAAPSAKVTPEKDSRLAQVMKAAPSAKVTPEKDSRLAQVIALLQRKSGCTLDELVEKTGWKEHTAQMFIYTSLPKAGYTATSTKAEGKERTFFLK
jgi:hypothetical protein